MTYVTLGSVLAIGILFIVSSMASVAGRFCVRHKLKIALGIDDWLSLAAMFFVIGCSCIMIVGHATHTIGSHSPDIGLRIFAYKSPRQQLSKKIEFAFYMLQIPALTLLKLSILCFYRRIFKTTDTFKACFWVLAASSILWGVAFFIAWPALCPHFEDRITSLQTLTTKCGNTFDMFICLAVLDVVVDLAILALPVPFIVKLEMPLRRKFAALGALLMGSLAIGCAMTRMIIISMLMGTPLFQVSSIAGVATTDFVGIVSMNMFWGMLEVGFGMIAICLPSLRPVVSIYRPEWLLRNLRSFRKSLKFVYS